MRLLLPFYCVIAFSAFAAWLDLINVLTYVGYELNADPMQVTLVAIAMLAPQMFFGRIFTVISLKFSFRQVMALTLVSRALLSFALIVAPNIEAIVIILVIRSFFLGFMQPAIATYVSQINTTTNIAGVLNMIVTSSKIIAPAIGGIFSVTTGEHFAFLISGILCISSMLLLLFTRNQKSAVDTTINKATRTPQKLAFYWLALFAIPIIFLDGISLLFTNLIPYSFSFYNVPKITLSIALSVSAIGNLMVGAMLVKHGKSNSNFYPVKNMAVGWCLNSSVFALLVLSMRLQQYSWIAIPVLFFILAGTKTFYDITLNNYVFSQEKERSAQLSSLRQSANAGAGVLMTLIGARALYFFQPSSVLLFATATSLLCVLGWLLLCQVLEFKSDLTVKIPMPDRVS